MTTLFISWTDTKRWIRHKLGPKNAKYISKNVFHTVLLSFCPHFSAQKPDCFFFTHLCFCLWQLQLRAGVPWLSSLGPALSLGPAELRGGRPRPHRDRPPGAGAGRLEAPLPSSLRRDDSACCLWSTEGGRGFRVCNHDTAFPQLRDDLKAKQHDFHSSLRRRNSRRLSSNAI